MAMFLATFRQSFAVIAFAATDRGLLDTETKHPFEICAPGELMSILRRETPRPDTAISARTGKKQWTSLPRP
ncbi:hypothetical protein ACVW1A_001341 [Bradyrhizobium sp. LB1.3]